MTTNAYVLRDSRGMFAGGNSISYDKNSGKFIYSFSKYLTNGFYTYPTKKVAYEDLVKLKKIAKEINFNIDFSIEQIDFINIIMYESKFKIPVYPFIHEIIERKQAIAWVKI